MDEHGVDSRGPGLFQEVSGVCVCVKGGETGREGERWREKDGGRKKEGRRKTEREE